MSGLQHGKSREVRHLELCFTRQAPELAGQVIPVWVRDGWNDDEKSVLADARKAGTDSPMISVFIPRRNSDELKQAIASVRAAEETLQVRGIPTTRRPGSAPGDGHPQADRGAHTPCSCGGGIEWRVRVPGWRQRIYRRRSQHCGAGRGPHALTRLYPHFDLADDPCWDKVIERTRKDGSALEVLGYHGDPGNHPVCAGSSRRLAR